MTYDLILKGGRVIDPSQKLDRVTDVAFSGGKVAKVGDELEATPSTDVRDVSGFIVTPGLIDLHTHVYWGGTSLGIDADAFCRDLRRHDLGRHRQRRARQLRRLPQARDRAVPRRASSPICTSRLPASSASRNTVMVGESEDTRLMAPSEAVEVADANRDVIVGIKVRVGRTPPATQGTAPLDIALQVADEVGMPLMAHIDHPPPSYEEVIEHAAAGRRADALLPPVPERALHGARAPSSRRCWTRASAA